MDMNLSDRKLSRNWSDRKLSRNLSDRKLSHASDKSRRRSLRPSISEYVRRASNYQIHQAKRKLSQKEKVLDKEIADEEREIKGNNLQKARKLGEIILHSKIVLLIVVIINLVDCCLVLGELILDIHYIKDMLHQTEETSNDFIYKMKDHYPDQLASVTAYNIDALYKQLLTADCSWQSGTERNIEHSSHSVHTHMKRNVDNEIPYTMHGGIQSNVSHHDSTAAHVNHGDGHGTGHGSHGHSVWEDIAHGLHKASITLLAILVFETLVKCFCMGKKFFNNKLEVFDGVIVFGSFILDLVFIKGLTIYRIQDNILILSFILPWRVIRVVNSLIVAIIDHEHFRLKLLYKEKKTLAAEARDLREKESKFESILTKIEAYCEREGIPRWKIRQHTATLRKQSTITSFASLALGGMLNGFLESAHNQHRPLGKALSEPLTVATAPFSGISQQISEPAAPASYNVRCPIAEEIEDDDQNGDMDPVSDSGKIHKDETVEDIQLKDSDDHVMIVITAAQEDKCENDQNDTEDKPLLRRQNGVDNEHEVATKQDKSDNKEIV